MMKTTTAAAAIGALILAAGAGPAMAGGYWDGGIVHEGGGEAGQRWDESCHCYCPDAQRDDGWREHASRGDEQRWARNDDRSGDDWRGDDWRGDDRGWRDEESWREEGPADEEETYTPTEFYEGEGGVGPNTFIDEGGGGGGGFAGANGIAVASAFADASASVDVNVDIRERERRQHDHNHMMQPYPPMHHDHQMQPYPPMHNQPMPPMHGYQPMPSMKGWGGGMGGMSSSWGHMGGYHAPMVMHRSGGGRRW
jgi:hypothetical protein